MGIISFKPQLSPKKMLELGVFGGWYFGTDIDEYPKDWFKKAKLSKDKFDVSLNYLALRQDFLDWNGKQKAGYFLKIHWVGFSGIADIQWDAVFQLLIEFK